MKLTLLVLLALIPAASAGASFFSWWRWPFTFGTGGFPRPRYNYGGHCTCTSPRIPLDDKLTLIGRDNDHDNDGIVTYDDFYYDITTRLDKNNDKRWSEGECIEGFRCRFGDTDYVAQYVCARILSGEASVDYTAYNVPPYDTGVPLEQFLQTNRERYETFYNNRCVNRDLTVEEKLTLNAANNDFNNDGLVTAQDIEYDLSNLYDADKNGEVSKAEFVARWVCNYGDTGDYARYLWDLFTQGATSVPNTYFSGPPFDTGVPIEDFKSNNRQNYENYRTTDASAYIQNRA